MPEFKRSRLARKEDEEITKKTVILGVVTVLFFGLVVVFGLPFLVKFSILLGDLKNKQGEEVKEKVLPPLPPRLVIPYEATNSAKIVIGGYAEPKVEVEVLKNDIALGKKEVNDNGEFTFDDVTLDEGENSFSAVAIGKDGASSEPSKPTTISLDKTPPEITMTNPSEEKLTVDYADFDVIGKTEKGVSVTINGHVAMVDDEGQFKLKIQLNSGNNDVEIKVRDSAGNETSKTISIKYDI